ncbi:MAG: MerR family transcriptional regulator [Oligoflexus sp.]
MAGDRLSVKTICKLTGINEHTLRAWERRYQIVEPDRLENGRRVYSLEDLEKLKLVNKLLSSGFLIGHIAGYKAAELAKLLQETAHKYGAVGPSQGTTKLFAKIERMLADFDIASLRTLIEKAHIEYGIRELLFEFLEPMLNKLSALVEAGKLHDGHQNLWDLNVKFLLTQILNQLDSGIRKDDFRSRSFICSSLQSGKAELQVMMASVVCAINEFPVVFIGQGLKAETLADTLMALKGNTIILNAIQKNSIEKVNLNGFIGKICQQVTGRCEVWLLGEVEPVQVEDYSLPIRRFHSLTDLDQNLVNVR